MVTIVWKTENPKASERRMTTHRRGVGEDFPLGSMGDQKLDVHRGGENPPLRFYPGTIAAKLFLLQLTTL